MSIGGGTPKCPYCGRSSRTVTGIELYPHRSDLVGLKFFQCKLCDAQVGTHLVTGRPLGSLANKSLRDLRVVVHRAFDKVWVYGNVSRSCAYDLLAKLLSLKKRDCHIGMFNEEMCHKVLKLCESNRLLQRSPQNVQSPKTPSPLVSPER